MTNDEALQALLVVAAGALGGYALYRFMKSDRFELPGRFEPAFEGGYDFDEPFGDDEEFEVEYPEAPMEGEDEFSGEGDEFAFEAAAPSRFAGYGSRAGAFGARAGRAGWGYAREKAPVLAGHARRAGRWAGEGVRSAYEATRRYDYRGGARKLGQGAMKIGRGLDELSYMDAPRAFAYPPSPVPAFAPMPSYRPVAKTLIMEAPPRMTVFGEPSPYALRNKRSRRRRRR